VSGWEWFEQGFTYWFGAGVAIVGVLYLGWCGILATLMLLNELQRQLQRIRERRAKASGAGPTTYWEPYVIANPSHVTVRIRKFHDGGPREDVELAKVAVRGEDVHVEDVRAQVRSAWKEAGDTCALLNDPFGPDGVMTEAEAIVARWVPPPGYTPSPGRAVDTRDGWTPPPVPGTPPVDVL
jgi:hypothetical protein